MRGDELLALLLQVLGSVGWGVVVGIAVGLLWRRVSPRRRPGVWTWKDRPPEQPRAVVVLLLTAAISGRGKSVFIDFALVLAFVIALGLTAWLIYTAGGLAPPRLSVGPGPVPLPGTDDGRMKAAELEHGRMQSLAK